MFNTKDTLFGKKDEAAPKDSKTGSMASTSTPQRAPSSVLGRTDSASTGAVTSGESAATGNYAGASSSASSSSAASTASAAIGSQSGSKLIVGPDIKLKGVEITDCDTLVVEGRVEASMDSRVIQIAEHGVYSGTVGIDVAEIHGRFEGELTARKQLIIHATGRVSGTIRYGKLTIEDGGELSGTISTLSANSGMQREKGSHATMIPGHDAYSSTKPAAQPH
jgi:cytoskeletal protein CcmA (bactofilin family)